MFYRRPFHIVFFITAYALLCLCAPARAKERSDADVGAVYTMSNDAGGNAVVVFARKTTGELTAKGAVSTGGRGLGTGLGNQGALALSDDGKWLVVVNPGSDDVSLFALSDGRPQLVDRAPSGGARPISVSIDDDLVYVLNAGSDSIAGFRLNPRGRLEPLTDSIRPLSASGVGAAEIGVSRSGDAVVVTEKATNRLTVYALGPDGRPAANAQIYVAPASTPFGFSFTRHRTLLVAQTGGGAPGGSSVSSYHVGRRGALTLLEAAVPTRQTAACWIVVTPGGRFAYTANTPASTLTGFSVDPRGQLTLLNDNGVAASTGANSGPVDTAITQEGRLLYTLDSQSHAISLFQIGHDGALTAGPTQPGLPAAANGIVAY